MAEGDSPSLFNPVVGELSSVVVDPILVIGIIAPAGIDKEPIIKSLKETLRTSNYKSESIRVMELLSEIPRYSCIKKASLEKSHPFEEDRIIELMNAGDHFREHVSHNALALLVVNEIAKRRTGKARQAYIVDSIKHPDELKTLKQVYDRFFLTISIYSTRTERVKQLAKKIAKSRNDTDEFEKFNSSAETIIKRDENDSKNAYGQKFRNTFPLADAFIDLSKNIESQCKRIVNLWFTNPDITPTADEVGMYLAHATALKSADLSRQVGAVVVSKNGSLLSSGFNEVPKPKGGSFWEDDDPHDARDMAKKEDPNQTIKDEAIREFIEELHNSGFIAKKHTTSSIINKLASADEVKPIRLFSLIEFGRVVHAEMNAISEAARRGVSLDGATLVCTTFPCHLCAKHIIAAGIIRVVFIEPYPKSLSSQLYEDLISFEQTNEKVSFVPFQGISPLRYYEFFNRGKRKDKKGKKLEWRAESAQPIYHSLVTDPLKVGEDRAGDIFAKILPEKLGTDPQNDLYSYQATKPKGRK